MPMLVSRTLLLKRVQESSRAFPEGVKEMTRSYIRSIWKVRKADGRTWENWRGDYRDLLQEVFGSYRALSQLDGDTPTDAPATLYGWRKAQTRYLDDLRRLM